MNTIKKLLCYVMVLTLVFTMNQYVGIRCRGTSTGANGSDRNSVSGDLPPAKGEGQEQEQGRTGSDTDSREFAIQSSSFWHWYAL